MKISCDEARIECRHFEMNDARVDIESVKINFVSNDFFQISSQDQDSYSAYLLIFIHQIQSHIFDI